MANAAIQKADLDRQILEGKITEIENKVNNHESSPLTLDAVQLHEKKLSSFTGLLHDAQFRILAQAPEDKDAYIKKFNEIDSKVDDILLKLMAIKRSIGGASSSTPPQAEQRSSSSTSITLPRIELPSFSGDYTEWHSFSDLFKATIACNSSLGNAQKLQYLKSAVKGEAADLIKSLSIINDNYEIAWATLKERYDHQREIATSLLRRLLHQPHLQRESAPALQKMIDTTMECLRSLEVLGRPTNTWDDMIVFILVERLDPETRKQWALQLTGTDLPTLKDLTTFIQQHVRGLQASSSSTVPGTRHSKVASHNTGLDQCPSCKQSHPIYRCEKFRNASPQERSTIVKKLHLCRNCLRAGHLSAQCSSSSTCKKCGGTHNTLLHTGNQPAPVTAAPQPIEVTARCTAVQRQGSYTTTANFTSVHASTQVLLGTIMAKVKDINGQSHQVRVLLDSASQCTMITEQLANALGLRRHHGNTFARNGVGETKAGHSRGEVTLTLQSALNDYSLNIQALVFNSVSGHVPSFNMPDQQHSHLQGLQLADPEYYRSAPVDILLDGDYTEEIMLHGRRRGKRFTPKAYNSKFGWVICGRVKNTEQDVQVHHTHCELESLVQRFWQMEQIPEIQHLTAEQQFCEEHFRDTVQRDETGRFIVKLPFNNRLPELGASRDMAVRRFLQVERRLTKNHEVRQQYIEFMREYEALGHMELIPISEEQETVGKTNYLPHHFVIKSDSSTTKLRVVFDASAKTSSGISLNDTLSVGATVQNDLFSILLKFRYYPIIIKADIAKMFRQFLVEHNHSDYQRIIWRESSHEPLKHYRLKTVTYGTACAPFLATRCLNQLAAENEQNNPLAAAVLKSNTYVDDSIPGATSASEGVELVQELIQVCSSAGMTLRKFCSNSKEVLETIPSELRETETSFDLDQSGGVKALGVMWNTETDSLLFSVNLVEPTKLTKRAMLSELAKVFDPLGLITPVTVIGKMLFQQVWKIERLTWDSCVPTDIETEWKEYVHNLQSLKQCAVDRCVLPVHNTYIELHGFSDASERAYGACVYIRYHDNGNFKSHMLTSKVRVAPLKRLSIERLELCGAALLAELMHSVHKTLNLKCNQFAWTDSTIVLRYIAAHPSRWKTFVAHKVAKIHELLPPEHWRHVKGVENPADLLSRGMPAFKINASSLWWQGPEWLEATQLPIPAPLPEVPASVQLEEKKKVVLVSHVVVDIDILHKYSSLTKLKRVTAYILRVLARAKRVKAKGQDKQPIQIVTGPLTPKELHDALMFWVKRTQQEVFGEEINRLQAAESPLPIKNTKSRKKKLNKNIGTLNPFLDDNGFLRVGGRLQNSDVSDDQKHQLIIPHNSILCKLLVDHAHRGLYHAGFQLTLSNLQQHYWITRSRSTIRQQIRRCVTCRRHKAEATQQLMGSLPSPRVRPSHPFQNTGIDYAGPFQLITMKGRKTQVFKGYFAIFVCMCTKAVHLEGVSDMTTETFISALKRFVARRGVCSSIFTDCGTNFVGADRELKQMLQASQRNQQVADHLSSMGVTWHFNTPGSPHQGGL